MSIHSHVSAILLKFRRINVLQEAIYLGAELSWGKHEVKYMLLIDIVTEDCSLCVFI